MAGNPAAETCACVRGSSTISECIVARVADGPNPTEMVRGYLQGLFPMDEPGSPGPVAWYRTDQRAVILPTEARVPRTVRRMLRRRGYAIRVDSAFGEVVQGCGGDRAGEWLTPRLRDAYLALHGAGIAHSVEAWSGDVLAGGLFGIWIGRFVSAESMFHRLPDGGNAALAGLLGLAWSSGAELIDVQMCSPHVARFGAREVAHEEFLRMLTRALTPPPPVPGT